MARRILMEKGLSFSILRNGFKAKTGKFRIDLKGLDQ
jgi:hypothetical protein